MTISAAVRAKHIQDLILTSPGRKKLAASMVQPIRSRRDYTSVGRKTFLVEELPDGANPYYDKDPDVTAYVVGDEGENIIAMVKPRRIQIPTFEIASNPVIKLTEIRQRRYNLIERAQDLGVAQIQAAEDERVFAVMDAVAANGFDSIPGGLNPDIPVVAPISGAVLADAFALIERHDLRVSRIYMNATDYADLRKFGRDILSIEAQDQLLKTGLQGVIWGAKVIVSRLVPVGFVYLCCESKFFGRIPVRSELTILSADNPTARMIGFSMFEELGIGCTNPRGLARLSITR